ncbi:MAG TPA: phage tail tip lysozyme [Streptosporangiaceae bacterium]
MSASLHGKERKIRRSGRHAAPTGVQKVARRAGMAAPAVAVVGALAAVPQVRAMVTGGSASAGSVAATQAAAPDVIGGASRSEEAHWVQHVKTKTARRASARASSPSVNDAAQPLDGSTPRPSATPSSGAGSSPPAATGGAVTCSATATGMLPENYATIVGFLTSHGYTGNAAAGIAGNMYQESKGNPESEGDGGGGLIGWTPLPAGLVTGNVAADLQTQLEAVLKFNDQWSQYLPALNSASTPAAAADIYVTDFERAGIPAAGTREAAADAVAAACGI